MAIPGHTPSNEPADTQVVSRGFDTVEDIPGGDDAVDAGSPLDAYRLPVSSDQLHAGTTTDLLKQFGQVDLFDSQRDLGDNRSAFADLRLDGTDQRLQALAQTFHTRPEKVAELLAAALKPTEIPPAEQQARCDAAHKECLDAIGNIARGTANAGDLASLLASYGTLNGFAKGSFAQSYVNAAIAAVRQGMAAATENLAHPTGLTTAEVMHQRLTRFQVDWREKNRLV